MVGLRRISTQALEHLRGRSVTEFALIAGALAVVVFVGFQTMAG